jgi:hypothetical protein
MKYYSPGSIRMKDLSRRAKEIIAKIEYVTIASVTNEGLPWNSPVFTAYDEGYNFYWGIIPRQPESKEYRSQ